LPHGPTVPDTIHGVITARIDRLPEETKRVLQAASVLGREVSLRLLNATWEGSGSVETHLSELKRIEFLYEQTWATEPVYLFKHALTQEVAYESLLTSRRQALHAAAGQALEGLHADRLEQVYDRLAYHYSKTEDSAKAVEYLVQFARQATRKFAHAEAVKALHEALGHVERLSAEEWEARLMDIVPRLARSLSALGRFQDALDLLLRQRDRVEQLQNPLITGRYYLLLARTYTFLADHEGTAQSANRAIEEAMQCNDEATMGKAYYVLALEDYRSGQLEPGVEHGRKAVSLLERTEERSWLGMAYFVVAMNYGFLGDLEPTLEAAAQAYAIGEALGDPRIQTPAAWVMGDVYVMRGEWEAGIETCQRAVKLAPDPHNTTDALAHLGIAYMEKGDLAQAIALLEQSVQQWSLFRLRQDQAMFTAFLSRAYLLNGQQEKALNLAMRGLELGWGTKYSQAVGLAQWALGLIAQARGKFSEAERHFKDALGTFTSINARYFVGRTHLDLAALTHARGNREAARTHLKEAHDLFTALRVPRYVERTEQLAMEFGVPLSEEPPR
ncbi:MAG: tetratricopeptide repeat protein, partial [Candidatus Rokubacteria bacterium]|nr:tetratricopeptide repeat protein [Candidatus Rokubacteria bacterium]